MSDRVDCTTTWPLLDPNDEDRAAGRTHKCGLSSGHLRTCRCHCGDETANPVDVTLARDFAEGFGNGDGRPWT